MAKDIPQFESFSVGVFTRGTSTNFGMSIEAYAPRGLLPFEPVTIFEQAIPHLARKNGVEHSLLCFHRLYFIQRYPAGGFLGRQHEWTSHGPRQRRHDTACLRRFGACASAGPSEDTVGRAKRLARHDVLESRAH